MGSESQLGEAFVSIRATLDKLDGDLAQARGKVEGAMKGMEDKSGKAGGALKALGTQVDKLKKQVPALGTAFNLLTNPLLLATAGLGAFTAASAKSVAATVAYNNQIRKTMQLTGLSAEETSRLVQVSDDWGLNIDEATSAMELMNKKGITPSIDNLAKIADEYVNATDKSTFMEEATKKYGKSFGDLIPILAKGGKALRDQADSISDNMIVTEKSIKASREYEVAMDDFEDAVKGVEYTLGNDLIPILVDTMQTLMGTYDATKHAEDGISGLDKAFINLNAGLAGLKEATRIVRLFGIAGAEIFSGRGWSAAKQKEAMDSIWGVKDAVVALGDATEGIIPSLYGEADAAGRVNDELREAENDLLIEQYTKQIEGAKRKIDNLAVANETAKRSISRLNEYINGTLGPQEEEFITTQGDLNTKMGEIQGEIDKAIKDGYDPLGEKILELKGTYAELKKQYDENATAHEEDTKRIILGILAQEMAAMGFSDSTAFARIAMKWGLIDEATMNAMMSTDKAINWLRNHPGDYAGFEARMNGVVTDVDGVTTAADTAAEAIDKITGQHEVGIHVTVTGDPIPTFEGGVWHPGTPYIPVATGFEGWVKKPTVFVAGEDNKPEYVSVTPSERFGDLLATIQNSVSRANMGSRGFADAMSNLSNYKLPTMAMKLERVNDSGGGGMATGGYGNQLQPAAAPIYITIQGTPEKEMDKRRQARYVAEEIQRKQR
jgi:hypothetical protein